MPTLAQLISPIRSRFRRWAAPPVFEDAVKTRTAALMNSLLLIAVGLWVALLILLALFRAGHRVNILMALGASAFLLVVRELLRRGHMTLAATLGIGVGWAVITGFLYNLGTPYSVHLFGYLVIVIVAAWLTGFRGGAAACLLSAASIFALARAEEAGLLPPAVRMPPLNLALNMAGYLGASSILFFLARTNSVRALGLAYDQIAKRARAEEALDQRVHELSSLQALSHVVSFRLPLEEVIETYLERLTTVAGLDMAQLFLLRGEQLHLAGIRTHEVALAAQDSSRGGAQNDMVLDVGECLCGLAVAGRQPVYAGDAESDARCTRDYCKAHGLHSLAALPLRSGEAIIAVLALGARAADAFAGRLTFLETAADQIAVRLQNALLLQEIRERAAGLEETVAERTRELQTERDRTQAILETVGESVVVTDLDGQVLFVNPATTVLTGFSRDEALGQPLWREWSVQALAETWPAAQQALADGQAWHGEIIGRRKDGAPYAIALTGAPLYDAGTASLPVAAVWAQRDITPLKEAARLKDQFVSNVSHELRTPISIIALSCDNLETFYDRLDESQRRQMLHDIHEQTRLLNSLVEDTLRISQIDGGYMPQKRSPVDLARLVAEEVERQQLPAESRGQQLTVTTGPAVGVLGNEGQLWQVVRNLLDNAIKYTPAGGRIRCTCEIRTAAPAPAPGSPPLPAKSWAVVEVTDDGIGIAAEDLPSVFERFYRAHAESEIPGTGLGLPIAKELVVLHGGVITAASTPGQGSTFTVYLPLGEAVTG